MRYIKGKNMLEVALKQGGIQSVKQAARAAAGRASASSTDELSTIKVVWPSGGVGGGGRKGNP